MKGDFTRLTFDPSNRYTSVLMQQGRLQLDADWNELVEIQNYLRQTQAHNVIGSSGVPKLGEDNQSFKVTAQNTDLAIAPGRIYVNGILCELDKQLLYTNQPDHPNALKSDLGEVGLQENTYYIAYLDVWQRHITAIDDSNIREKALIGIPDTSTRTQTVWQVKLLEVGGGKNNADNVWKQFIENHSFEHKGLLQASLTSETQTEEIKLENRLYRVEIHQGGKLEDAQFKWSRDNGSIVSQAKLNTDTKTITIRGFGQDDRRSFETGQWIEIFGEAEELNQTPGTFLRLNNQTQGNKLVYDDVIPDAIANQENLKVRRWDQNPSNNSSATLPTTPGKHLLENGIQVEFTSPNNSTAFLNPGDYWLIPARSVDNDIEWPKDEAQQRRSLPPRGIRHYYTRLALLFFQNNEDGFALDTDQEKYKDYRQTFPPLINCFDKTSDDTISGKLTIEGGLFVTGKEENGQYVPAKVGIGTTEPTARLEIDGKDNNEQEAIFHVKNENNSFLYVRNNGNVGIKTNSPDADLDVSGKIKTTDLDVTGTFTANTFEGEKFQVIQKLAANPEQKITYASIQVTGEDSKQVELKAESGANFIFTGGNVGIGTNPSNDIRLTVGDKTQINELTVLANSFLQNNVGIGTNPTDTARLQIVKGNQQEFALNVTGASKLDFLQLENGASVNEFSNSGNLRDIDTAVPTEIAVKNYVSGQIQEQTQLVNQALASKASLEGASTQNFNTQNLGVNGMFTINTSPQQQGGIPITIDNSSTSQEFNDENRFVIPTKGAVQNFVNDALASKANLGGSSSQDFSTRNLAVRSNIILGLPQPATAALQINLGDRQRIGQVIKAAPQQATNLQEWQNFNGQVLAHIDNTGVYHIGSSRQIKDNISELSSQEVNKLLSELNPVKFSYQSDQTHKIHLGFISEESPDWMTCADKKSISLMDVVGALTKVVKDHRRTITVLADFIDNQQREIEMLKSEMTALKAQIRHR